ncbi:YheC/YheD family protein [Priestia megaterium]|uniref:YheC/YheD family protein n=1 Tax=Priestia megaterium TaxID=1404 RepID=UPI003EF049C4
MIIIGENKQEVPIVGICVSEEKPEFQRLVRKRLEQYYGNITLIRFHIKDLNLKNRQIKGDSFMKRKGMIHKKHGVFPIPQVIYLQCYVEPKVVEEMEQLIGHKVFNSFIFDKWECWKLLHQDTELSPYLPYTQKMENEVMLQLSLFIYKDIFLKPISPSYGHSSKGIFRVKWKADGKVQVTYRKGKEMQKVSFDSYEKFRNWISRILSESYIIQQSIQTKTWHQKVTDLRLNMNKNGQGKWKVTLLILRIASNDSHIAKKVLAAHPMKNLIKLFPDDKNMDGIEGIVNNLGFKICNSLDKSGHHMADLGIDLGIDESGHVWIFEINPLPHPLKGVSDLSWTRPIEYAAYLSIT